MPNKLSTKKEQVALQRMLQKIQDGSISTLAAAAAMGVSTRTFNRMMLEAKVKRPEGQRAAQDKGAAESKTLRQEAAQHVLNGTYTVAKAARLAGCSERTVTRYMDRLRASRPGHRAAGR